jgi:hypothetical protein
MIGSGKRVTQKGKLWGKRKEDVSIVLTNYTNVFPVFINTSSLYSAAALDSVLIHWQE